MTLRSVALAVSLIVASVGCGTKPKEPSKPAVTETEAIEQQSAVAQTPQLAPSVAQPFVLPEHSARCIANELVVTTYLRGGPEHLTVNTDIVLSEDVTPTSDEFLRYGMGIPLLQWTYDGRTLTKADAWRAYVAQQACGLRPLWDDIIIYCIWERASKTRSQTIGDCVRRIDEKGLTGADAYRHWTTRSFLAAANIIDMNQGAINAVIARLQRPHDRKAIAILSGVGDAPVDDCRIRQWQFGWYRDLLRDHPISYNPVHDVAPGKYPVAVDDGACPIPGPAHPRTIEQLDTLSNATYNDMNEVFGLEMTRFIHFNGSPRLTHFLNVQFDPNDFRAIPQIDAVVSRRLRDANKTR